MVALSFAVLVGAAIITCLFMAWVLGANSNSPPFAPAIGANAISTMRAAFVIGLLAAAGALMQGGSISETVGADLIDGVTITPLAATAGLLTAATFMAIGIYTRYPIPAAFATTGAMVGVGLSLGGDPAMATYQRLGTFWLLVPFMSGGLAYATAVTLRRDDIPESVGVPLLAAIVGAIVANIRLGAIPDPAAEQGTLARFLSQPFGGGPVLVGDVDLGMIFVTIGIGALAFYWIRKHVLDSVDHGIRSFLLVLGGIVAFSSGGSQVGLATGPLENLFRIELGLPGITLLALGATGILAGAWMGAPRLLQATSREYAQLGVRRSIAALVPGFIIAQLAIALGIPISLNNIILSGVIGGGLAAGSAGVSKQKIGFTIVFWLLTLGTSIGVGYGLYQLLAALIGG
ncbi:transport protein (probable substrate phosphate/sulfate) [Natrialba magadii ATCC 43099]|uniref:Phosphate transporter n=1 Tax=Natrialba magadii (strain ATCC 43099 / DSM 3394 / CCM 3739 / CIP 104546 / IAM 13178 / JCM 8861 / NBRC 102185 / NCIMB 2190 / MS3) TaxID=547559 RepID=D3SVD0_NATMM|nr:inorganic phosphate transporter [Natrialba magadii]ADD05538.1 transport protein (probable substrate phosphate/sulfate) [Natrialba magadii ATCC 43099]ELY29500.1 phosphate transporter [Natrialba magadii ATCC 43099]